MWRAFFYSVAILGCALVTEISAASPGDLDPTFGTAGTVQLSPTSTNVSAAAIAPDGNVYVVLSGARSFQVTRLTSQGNVDSSFGGTGTVTTQIGFSTSDSLAAYVQPDGNLLVAGLAAQLDANNVIAVVRYRPDGTLDPSFNHGAPVATSTQGGSFVSSVRTLSSGEILVTGNFGAPSPTGLPPGSVFRYTADGQFEGVIRVMGPQPDPFFPPPFFTSTYATQPLASGDFLVAGSVAIDGQSPTMAVLRLHGNGILDRTFGAAGGVVIPFSGTAAATDMAMYSDGRVLFTGWVLDQTILGTRYGFGIVRINADGSLDSTFGNMGKVFRPSTGTYEPNGFGFPGWPSPHASVLIQGDGKVLLVAQSNFQVLLARYNADGSVDPTFGQGGQSIGPGSSYIGRAAALTGGGQLVLGLSNPAEVQRRLLAGSFTTTTIQTSLNPAPSNQPVTLSATVAANVAGGTVTFLDAATTLPGCAVVTPALSGGIATATCMVSGLSVGTHALTAKYSGDTVAPGSQSAVLLQTMNAPGTETAVEYYNVGFNHFFMTSLATEIMSLDSAPSGGWTRTGQTFLTYPLDTAGSVPMCRFFSGATFAPQSSHFYTPYDVECSALKQSTVWQFEGNVMAVQLPSDSGACAQGLSPLYRVYNNGQGGAPNHRYTTSLMIRTSMLSLGWIPEGFGTVGVIACLPPSN